MSDSPFIVEVTRENFQQVMEASQRVPILMDFWAPWCEPCKALLPVLEHLANEFQGRFYLAKVNTEDQQEVAAQFGIRSVPAVKLFMNGQEVDEFTGALPESEVRVFLEKHLPRPSDGLVAQAQQALLDGDADTALAALQQAKQMDPGNHHIDVTLAQTLAAMGDTEGAKAALDALPEEVQQTPEVVALRGHMEFESQAANAPDVASLEQRLAANPDDSEARYQLALHKINAQDYEAALDLLLELMRRDRAYEDDAARKTMVKVFDLLGDDPMAARYRSRMFTLLH